MRLVYKFYINHTEKMDNLFKVSNNLYNQALYQFRQRLDADGTWLWYSDMDKLMKHTLNLEGECNYKLLKAQCSQQILRTLDRSIRAYCKSIKDWKKHPKKYSGMPRMPHYRKRGGDVQLVLYQPVLPNKERSYIPVQRLVGENSTVGEVRWQYQVFLSGADDTQQA